MQLTITDSDLLNPALAESLVVFIQHAARLSELEGGDEQAPRDDGYIQTEAAPVESQATFPAPTAAVVAPPPPPFTPEEVDEHAGPQVAPVNGLDSAGLPWDEKIHSATKATNADGTWRRRRGVDDAVYNARVAELRGQATTPAPTPTADTPFNPNDGFDAFARSGVVAPPPPPVPVVQQPAPAPEPAAVVPPPPPAPAAIADPYVALIQKITREGITADRYTKALAIGGLPNLAAGMANPTGALAALEALNDGRA